MGNQGVIGLSKMKYDFLRELGSIGGGCATTSLSVLLNSQLTMDVPEVKVLSFLELTEMLGGAENLVVAVVSPIVGDLNGIMMFVLEADKARHLTNVIVEEDVSEVDFSDMDLSAIKEIGNIIISTYLASLEALTKFKIRTSPPEMSIDMAGAILSIPAIEFGEDGDQALIIESSFKEDKHDINGNIILISEVNSYDKMYKALGVG